MRLCLSCFHFIAGGNRYCPYCRRTPGVRLCKKGHVSPSGSLCCSECGSRELSEPGRSVGFGWMVQPLAFFCLLLLARQAAAHFGVLSGLAVRCLLWTLGFALDLPPDGVSRLLLSASAWLAALALVSPLLPPSLRSFLKAFGRLAGRLLRHSMRILLKLLASLLRPPKGS